jgi:two-component system nitrate/nitrite response regulator NarL
MRRRSIATVLVGPSALLREGLSRILGPTGFRIVASVSHIHEVVWASLSSHQSILLIIDTGDDPDDDTAQIRLFKEQKPSGRVAVLTDRYRRSDMVSAFQAGANVYHAKFANCDAFTKALELVMLGETILPRELLSFVGDRKDDQESPPTLPERVTAGDALPPIRSDDMPRLSIREKCILRCIVDGDSNKLIARKIGIAEATVKVHVKAILRKIRIHNRTQAAIWAMNNSTFISPTNDGALPTAAIQVPPLLALEKHTASPQLPALIGQAVALK